MGLVFVIRKESCDAYGAAKPSLARQKLWNAEMANVFGD